MLQPPGSGTTALPRRANSGPSTQKLARKRRTRRQRARTGPRIDRLQPQPVAGPGNRQAQVFEHQGHGADVGQLRHAAKLDRLLGEDRGRHHRQRGVLRAAGFHRAAQRRAARMVKWDKFRDLGIGGFRGLVDLVVADDSRHRLRFRLCPALSRRA